MNDPRIIVAAVWLTLFLCILGIALIMDLWRLDRIYGRGTPFASCAMIVAGVTLISIAAVILSHVYFFRTNGAP